MHGAQQCHVCDGSQRLQNPLAWGMVQWGQHWAGWELCTLRWLGGIPCGLTQVESEGWHLLLVPAGMLPLHPRFAWICCGCRAARVRCGHLGGWVMATGDNGHYCHWGPAPLAQAGGSPVCRSSGRQQMRGFVQCFLLRALWPQRKDQSGSRGWGGCSVSAKCNSAWEQQHSPSRSQSCPTTVWGRDTLQALGQPQFGPCPGKALEHSPATPQPCPAASGRIQRCNHP